ncbi:MAG: hypothetical protein R3F46_02945 [bacterium]
MTKKEDEPRESRSVPDGKGTVSPGRCSTFNGPVESCTATAACHSSL